MGLKTLTIDIATWAALQRRVRDLEHRLAIHREELQLEQRRAERAEEAQRHAFRLAAWGSGARRT